MRIHGIGIDVVEVERIGSSMAEFGERFAVKIFTERERAYCDAQKRPEIHYAARFAAKEAIAKAFGTGIGKDLGWLDMEITRKDSGEPAGNNDETWPNAALNASSGPKSAARRRR